MPETEIEAVVTKGLTFFKGRMSKEIQRLDIIFREPTATYKAGETVSGFLQLDLGQELKLKGITIQTQGVARVHWDEKRAYTKGSSAKLSHGSAESCLDDIYVILNKGDTLTPGKHSWPFLVRLPAFLPSSYDGQWGRVQYTAKAVLERPWKGDIDFTKTFLVLGLLDLNTEPDAKKPTENISEAVVGTGCCRGAGPISGHVMLTRRGFSIGQNIPFTTNIDNRSTRTFNVRIVLSQQTTFRADKQVRRSNNVLRVLTKGEVTGRQAITWQDQVKAIPTVPPTKLGGGCKTIEVKYLLTLILAPSGPGKEVEVPVEIIIGTTPLRKVDQTDPAGQQQAQQQPGAKTSGSGGS